jgi:integrase
MGGKPAGAIICPRGVSIREFKHERRIQIAFSYRGTECRELLPPQTITKSALVYASGLRAEIQRKIKDGVFAYADYFPDSEKVKRFGKASKHVLIGELLEGQLEIYEGQVKNQTLSPSTLDGYRKAIKSKRMQYWAKKTLAEATPSALRTWIGEMNVTAKFSRNLLTPLRSVFEDALNDDLITFNPFERIALTKLLKQTATASEYEVDPFTADERARLVDAARPDERAMVQFWFETGLRPGELQALRWSRIDLKACTARIDENQVAKVTKGPKTAAGVREMDLSPAAMAALEAQKPVTMLAGQHVWLNPRKAIAWESDAQIRKTLWVPLCERAEIRYRNPYQVRHTYASALLTAGTNPWYVAQQLGHVDVTMVFQTYGKFIGEDYQKPKAQLRSVA